MANQKLMFVLGTVIILIIAVGFVSSTWNAGTAESTENTSTPSASPTNTTTIQPTTEPNTPTPTPSPTNTITPTTENPNNSPTVTNTPTPTTTSNPTPTTTPSNTPSPTPTPTPTSTPSNPSVNTNYAVYIATSNASSTTVAQTLSNNKNDHDKTQDYTWNNSDVITVRLNGNSISVDRANSTTISGTTLIITSAGTYSISGTLNNGQIIVNTNDNSIVRLILNGTTVSSTTKAPIYVASAKKTILILASNTENHLTDTQNNADNATIYSKDDLTIYGEGALTINANANDGIRSNDGLVIKSGKITVNSVDDGICGKDYIVIRGGAVTVNSVGDGLKSDNNAEADRGYILIENGTITINSSQGDAISAETDVLITNGTFTLTSGGGSNTVPNPAVSTRGLKGNANVVIDHGNFVIRSSDDSIHSNGTIALNNGKYDLAAGDDAIHADIKLEINGGEFNISKSFEGLESQDITITNGYFQIKSSDDGINCAGGNDGSSTDWRPWQRPPTQGFPVAGNYHLNITGGFIYVNAVGDGVDINGYIAMSGGVLIIDGPIVNFNGAVDYDGSFNITGGTLIGVGSSGMAQASSVTSTQYSVLVNFNAQQTANKLISIQKASGEVLLTFSPAKAYQSIVYSSPNLTVGSYDLYLGGSSTGTVAYGVYEGGVYSAGSKYASFSVSGIVTTVR